MLTKYNAWSSIRSWIKKKKIAIEIGTMKMFQNLDYGDDYTTENILNL